MLERSKRPLRILAIEGGGHRGVIPAVVLAHLEKRAGYPISQLFDMIVAGSTGGLLGLCLTAPNSLGRPRLSAAELVSLYRASGMKLFPETRWQQLRGTDFAFNDAGGDIAAERLFASLFGGLRHSAALTETVIPTYDLKLRTGFTHRSSWAKQFPSFDTHMAAIAVNSSLRNMCLDAEMASQCTRNDLMVLADTAAYVSSSTMCALAEVKRRGCGQDCIVVSVGAGQYTTQLNFAEAIRAGTMGFVGPLFEMMSQGINATAELALKQQLPNSGGARRHCRLQVQISPAFDHGPSSLATVADYEALTLAALDRYEAEIDALLEILAAAMIPFPLVA